MLPCLLAKGPVDMNYQLVLPSTHRANNAERKIQKSKKIPQQDYAHRLKLPPPIVGQTSTTS